MGQEPLITIKQASSILGVSEAALRQWTDEGKIEAFVTPGGHRRYSKADLIKLKGSHQKPFDIKDLASELKNTSSMHDELASSFLHTTWFIRIDKESQANLANSGRNLLRLVVDYITKPYRREETTGAIRQVGVAFGYALAKLDLPLTDSVEAFILHRDPIINAATDIVKKRAAYSGRVISAIPLVAKAMDEALLSLVAAHQQYHNNKQ